MDAKTGGYKELLAQRAALEQQIEEMRSVEREGVIAEIQEKMVLFGISPDDLVRSDGRKTRHQRGPVAAKYQHPETGATWTGRGRAPRWIVNQDAERFRIK